MYSDVRGDLISICKIPRERLHFVTPDLPDTHFRV